MPKAAVAAVKPAVDKKELNKKMARATAGTGASLVPPGIGGTPLPPPRKEKEVVPGVDEVIADDSDKAILRELVQCYATRNATKKKLEKELKPLGESIKVMLGSYGLSKLTCDGLPISYYNMQRSTIDRDLLIASGVDPATIDACTRVSSSLTLKIGAEKE